MADPQATQPSFDVDGARKAGYSDDEIAQHLAQTRGFDYQGAIKAGYTPADVLQHLSGQAATTTPPNPDEAKGVYQNIGEGIKEAWDVPKMLDQAGDAVGKLVDVATGDAKSQNNLRHPIEFAKRLISGVTGPSNLSTSEKVARGVGNVAGGAMLGSVAPEAGAAVDAAPGAAADALGQNFSKSAVTRNMGKEISGSLDRVADEAGLPASKQPALSGKAAEVVSGLKQQAQKIYTALDKASGGRYQRFVDKIDELEDALRSKYTTPDVAAKLKDQLVEVRGDYAQTQADLVKQGVDPATIKAADAKWAQAKALEQVGKKFKVGESLSGDLKPGTPSIDTGLKNLKQHILPQATKAEAPAIRESVTDATKQYGKVARNQKIAGAAAALSGAGYGVHKIIKTLSGDH